MEFILILVIAYILFRLRKYRKLIETLSTRIARLEQHLARPEKPAEAPQVEAAKITDLPPPPARPGVYPSPPQPVPPAVSVSHAEPAAALKAPAVTVEKTPAEKPAPPPKRYSETWSKIEKQLAENWTGISGAVILVMGVGFFGIYAALKLSPFFRFLMIAGFSAILGGISFYLGSQAKWLKLASWLRSSAAAIFLFACLGAGGIPGLQWIENPFAALALLVAGILLNLYMGYAGKRQAFASLHVLLSLVALSIAPQSNTIFILAAVVSLFGIALSYREKWDYHLLLTISSFFLFHLFWYFSMEPAGLGRGQNLLGIIAVVMISVSAALIHYREAYRTTAFAALPFSVHLVNWFYFGLGLLLHTVGSKWKTIFIALGAVAAFFLAKKAQKTGIRWLYHTDTLIAQSTALIAIITLANWEIDRLTILGLLFLQTLIFAVIMLKEQEGLLYRIGVYTIHLTALILILNALPVAGEENKSLLYRNALVLFISAAAATAFHVYTTRQPRERFDPLDYLVRIDRPWNFSLLAVLAGLMVVGIYANLYRIPWTEYLAVAATLPLVYLRQRLQSTGLGIGAIIALAGLHAIFWNQAAGQTALPAYEKLARSLPFFVLSLSLLKWSYVEMLNKHLKWIGIYFFALHAMFAVYFIFNPVSPLIPGVAWLVLSLVALELSNFFYSRYKNELEFRGEPDRFLLHAGFVLIAAFIARHILIHLQAENYFWIFKLRLLIEVFAVGVFAYWAAFKRPLAQKSYASWIYLHPLFVELMLLFIVLAVSVELHEFWHSLVWMGLAFGALFIGSRYAENLSRLRFYSLIFNWAAAFQVAFLTGVYVTPSTRWYEQAWLSGCIAILLQFFYLYYFYRRERLEGIRLPASIGFLQAWVRAVNRRRNLWIFIPVILCVAIFFYWSFDKSILTLLWVIECFFIFILSIMLKENHFRYIALTGLGLSIVRLIFYDLAQANTITRAIVFLGVGLILLLINSAYNKYKDRFGHE